MKNQPSFSNIELNRSEKVTKSKLIRQFEELNIDYELEEDENGFAFIIDIPEEHIIKRKKQMEQLGSLESTEFEKRNILPILKRIKSSINLDCNLDKSEDQTIKIQVFKK